MNHQPEFAGACVNASADRAVLEGSLALALTAIDIANGPTAGAAEVGRSPSELSAGGRWRRPPRSSRTRSDAAGPRPGYRRCSSTLGPTAVASRAPSRRGRPGNRRCCRSADVSGPVGGIRLIRVSLGSAIRHRTGLALRAPPLRTMILIWFAGSDRGAAGMWCPHGGLARLRRARRGGRLVSSRPSDRCRSGRRSGGARSRRSPRYR